MANNLIVKSNALVQAGHRLSLTEQRMILTAISKIRRDQDPDVDTWHTVTAKDLAEPAGISLSRAYHDLADSVESLWKREITIKGGPNGATDTPEKSSVMKVRWVQAVYYLPAEGAVKIMFSSPVIPYLTSLKEQFTKYELEYVSPMKSRFGPRLYELLMQFRKAKEREITIAEIQDMWETNYDRIYDFKRWVITPAVNDVNQFSNLKVVVSYKKTGRRVTHIHFKFKDKSALKTAEIIDQLPQEQPKKVLKNQSEADKLAKPGEDYPQLFARLNREGYTIKFKPSYS